MSSSDFEATDFFAKMSWDVKGHVLDMSCVLKCVLKFSRGWDRPLPTKVCMTFKLILFKLLHSLMLGKYNF